MWKNFFHDVDKPKPLIVDANQHLLFNGCIELQWAQYYHGFGIDDLF